MERYPKIHTVYKRDPKTNYRTLLEGQFSIPEFEYLKDQQWVWTEKFDGVNIRVQYAGGPVYFRGRIDSSEIPTFLIEKLRSLFLEEYLKAIFPGEIPQVCLYGESYGRKVQIWMKGKLKTLDEIKKLSLEIKESGSHILDGIGFVLFDVRIGDIWLERENVEDIASKFDIPITPIVGEGTLLEAVELVRSGFPSLLRGAPSEGLIMRPKVELLDRHGSRIITKLKLQDFE